MKNLRRVGRDMQGTRSSLFGTHTHIQWLLFWGLALLISSCSGRAGEPSAQKTPVPTLLPMRTVMATDIHSDWPTYHQNPTRTGYVTGVSAPQRLTKDWMATLDGAVYAEPLAVSGKLLVATESNSLYALDSTTGTVLWKTTVGAPVAQSTLPCGDIDPLGITGTPVYDDATGLLFAVAEVNGPKHILVAVDIQTGQIRFQRSVDTPGMNARVYQQRAALLLSQKRVYIAYGGLAGDCGDYHGTIVAVQTDGQGPLLSYQVPVTREGGIWAPSGPSTDASGKIYLAVGNGEATSDPWDHSDSVLRLSPTLQLEDAFAPSGWQDENSHDTDLGSMGPTLLANGGLFIAGKSGRGYLLNAQTLGGIGGELSSLQICNGVAMGGTASAGSQIFVPCNDGLRSITIDAHQHMTINWKATPIMSPVIGGDTVYSLDPGGTLYALAKDSGKIEARLALGTTSSFSLPHFTTLTLYGTHIFIPTYTGVIAVNL
ncbi:outer membrane protein assembly factor BamB family protein [Tengunoibacter tsumagoiensis]|uniref:Pyrrolo-quinoline quinone repeat domain-containing protein n=1 Tax=Tengunoibacter tsumagoiensis TaxID=2014871 RepID=A0A402A3C6_9CHLR|nr:PQQ-binding-like beta-propeller repeat protein [Tengunoibacter tsumagoiensis]GCE13653.1 hypothetical protein KTT_35120 [Tengunoibacter tsumagoiensis]